MSVDVVMERRWEPPLDEPGIFAMFAGARDCLAIHRCDWQSSLFWHDGRDSLCHFRCPDAESLRIAMRQAGSPRGRVWASVIHDAPDCTDADLAHANVLVSRSFDRPVEYAEIQALARAREGCMQMHHVQFVRNYCSLDRKRMMCLYRAPDAESVRIAQQQAAMPFEHLWAVRRMAP